MRDPLSTSSAQAVAHAQLYGFSAPSNCLHAVAQAQAVASCQGQAFAAAVANASSQAASCLAPQYPKCSESTDLFLKTIATPCCGSQDAVNAKGCSCVA